MNELRREIELEEGEIKHEEDLTMLRQRLQDAEDVKAEFDRIRKEREENKRQEEQQQ